MALNSKYHIKIGDFGFLLARSDRANTHLYNREEAPAFVNKFSSGDPNYRDSTFFASWVVLDWLNGFNQEFFDDPSRFWKSSGLDTTQLLQLSLEKRFDSIGSLANGRKVTSQDAWRSPGVEYFGDGSNGALTISADTTEAPIDSSAVGTQGSYSLTATNASFAIGQEILIHQTMGTNAGTWQRTKILGYTAGTITTRDPLSIDYSCTGSNKAQVRVIPQYTDVTIDATKTYTAKAWDGTVGGILCFLASGTITVNGTITATGKGFRGGAATSTTGTQGESSTATGTLSTSANGMGAGGGAYGDGAAAGGGGGGGHAASGTAGQPGARGAGAGGGTGGNSSLTTMLFGGAGGAGGKRQGVASTPGAGGNAGGIIFMIGTAVNIGASASVAASGNNGGANSNPSDSNGGGGGGAGGSVLIKAQTASLGTTRIAVAAGTGGAGGSGSNNNGGAGAVGRIHLDYYSSYTGSTSPTLDATQDGSLTSTAIGSSYTLMVGCDDGKVYSWDNSSTFTEMFNVNRLEWYETGGDGNKIIGDTGGTETAQAQGFQLDEAMYVQGVEVYLKKNAGTPGDITVRIETDNAGKPSGTLANAALATTIPAFTTDTYGWKTVTFSSAIQLAKTTTYWIVLKTAAAANDNNYAWQSDDSSPSYSASTMAASTDGGSTWSAVSGSDAYFRVLSETVGITATVLSDLSSTTKLYYGTGNFSSTHVGGARIYSYDGTTWALVKIFTGTTESSIGAMQAYGINTPSVYIGLGHKAKVYVTTAFATFTLSKTITEPRNPGFVLSMADYGGTLYVGGGYPEQLYGNNTQYNGFLYSYDEYSWNGPVGTFEHTVVMSLETFDTLLFIGTIKKRLYVFNTATIDKLFEFPFDCAMPSIKKYDDKLAITTIPRPGTSLSGEEGVYLFDRNGIHRAFSITDKSFNSIFVFNNNLVAGSTDGVMYSTSPTTYQTEGWIQTSYFEAQLPSIDKLLREVTLITEPIPTGCSLTVYYRYKEADSWTSLGAASTVGETSTTIAFPVASYTKKISLKIVLASADGSNTPTLKKQILKYQLGPDFKYMWKMTIVCVDNIVWLDGTEPAGLMSTGCTAEDTTLALLDADGMPDPDGSTFYASVVDDFDNVLDSFTYTGKTGDTLTGIPATGTYSLSTHAANTRVKVLGRDLHKNLLELKRTKTFYTYTDIDGNTYTTYFHSFQTDGWAIDTTVGRDLQENEVPVTLLEA